MNVRCVHPSQLAPLLYQSELDIALIPVFEYLRHVESYQILDGFGIASRGKVLSVFVACRKPLREIKTLWLDTASLTSVHLFKVLAARHLHITPRYVTSPEGADALLLIGDQALQFIHEEPDTPRLDLGESWQEYCGLPFVYAAWVVRNEAASRREELESFRSLCAEGVKNRLRLASTPLEREYLDERIQHAIGPQEKEGLEKFRHDLFDLGFIQDGKTSLRYL